MSGRRTKDLEGGSLQIYGELTIDEDRDAFFRSVTVQGNVDADAINTLSLLVDGQPVGGGGTIEGLLGFWTRWDQFNKPIIQWAVLDGETGETRFRVPFTYGGDAPAPGVKSQFGKGPAGSICTVLVADFAPSENAIVTLDLTTKLFTRLVMGPPPANHLAVEVATYDRVAGYYVGVCRTTPSVGVVLVSIDPVTGAISPITSYANRTTSIGAQLTDVEIIDDTVLVVNRDTTFNEQMRIHRFDRVTGLYLGNSFITGIGTIVPYPGQMLWTWVQEVVAAPADFFIIAIGYDAASQRLYCLINSGGNTVRVIGYIQGTSSADLLSQVATGAYTFRLLKLAPEYPLNAIVHAS